MKLAAHVNALSKVFDSSADPVLYGQITASIISANSLVLDEYDRELKKNILYLAWFNSASSKNRIFIHPNESPRKITAFPKLSDIDSCYISAAYYGASNIIFDSKSNYSASDISALTNIGFDIKEVISGPLQPYHADNPVNCINLKRGGIASPELINRYAYPEDRVVIYDKYINSAGMLFIQDLCSRLSNNTDVIIITSSKGGNCLSPNQIKIALNKKFPLLNISTDEGTPACLKSFHDRYIFFGERLMIELTVGTDCFGPIDSITGNHNNRESAIYIHDTTDGYYVDLNGKNLGKINIRWRKQ